MSSMTDDDSNNIRHVTPYSNEELTLALLRGGRPTLLVGPLPGFEAHAIDLVCPLTALVNDRRAHDALVAAGHETHLIDLDDPDLLAPLGSRLFDQVISPHLLQISAEPANLLQGLTKHMTPHGQLIISAPNVSHVDVVLSTLLGRIHQDPFHNQPTRRFDLPTIELLLTGAGLWIETIMEVHRRASADLLEDLRQRGVAGVKSVAEAAFAASKVSEWVFVAGPSPERHPQESMTRRLLRDATVRSQAIDETTDYAHSLEERLRASRAELARVLEVHRAEIGALRADLADASLLEREVGWQREMVTKLASRLHEAEVRLAEANESHSNATTTKANARRELVLTRRRIGFILMDSLAQRVYRHRILVFLIIRPLRRIVKRR